MTHSETPSNRRGNIRLAPMDERQKQGRLIVGRNRISCQIDNESAGGYKVAVKKRVFFKKGQELELQQVGRSSPVEVLWSRREADGTTTIGLERLPEKKTHIDRRGGRILIAIVVVLAFVAGYLIKTDNSVQLFLKRHVSQSQ